MAAQKVGFTPRLLRQVALIGKFQAQLHWNTYQSWAWNLPVRATCPGSMQKPYHSLASDNPLWKYYRPKTFPASEARASALLTSTWTQTNAAYYEPSYFCRQRFTTLHRKARASAFLLEHELMRIITNPLLFCVGQDFWPCTGRHAQMHRVHKHRRDVTHCGRYPIRCGYWLRQNEGTCVFVVSVITLTVFLCWCVWNRASRPVRCGHWLRQNEGTCVFGASVLTLTVFLCWCVWNWASRPVRCGHWLRQNEGTCVFGASVLTLTVFRYWWI